jgi:2,3-dihydroxyphenylpropionate 1,2-dioxygenase
MTIVNENVMFGCVTHSPIIMVRTRAPKEETRIQQACEAFRERVEAFAPDYVVLFSNDHFAGFFYANMPPYCIGAGCEAIADVGGTAGTIPVPKEDAISLVSYLRDRDFDPAISYRMRVDHGFSQPLTRLLGGIDRWPVIPIFTSTFTPPLMTFRRSRLFGTEVGRFVAESGKRVLILGSGGLSHHPARYFPAPADAPPDVYAWQLDGEREGTFTQAEWLERLDDMHREGAAWIAAGKRTPADMRLNRDFDEDVLRRLSQRDLASMDHWDQTDLVERAGLGALEIHNWVAATAAYAAAGGGDVLANYDFLPDYAVGYAFMHSR